MGRVLQGTDVSELEPTPLLAADPLRSLCRSLIQDATHDKLRDVLGLLLASATDRDEAEMPGRLVITLQRGDSYAVDTVVGAPTEMAAIRGVVEQIVSGNAQFEEVRHKLSDDILDEYGF